MILRLIIYYNIKLFWHQPPKKINIKHEKYHHITGKTLNHDGSNYHYCPAKCTSG